MKNIHSRIFASFGLMTAFLLLSFTGNSQDRKLPDGTIVYSDGTKRLPNGTIIYKDGNTGNNGNNDNFPSNNGGVRLPDGSIVYPDGSRRYPDRADRSDRFKNKRNNGQWLPPGQAKKIYGGSAKDYAPGQQKKWKGNGHGKGKHKDD